MSSLYRLYIDESGDHTYTSLHDPTRKYLGLTGTIFKKNDIPIFVQQLEDLKKKHFPYDPDEPFVFSRKAIMHRKGVFGRLNNPAIEVAFNKDLIALFQYSLYRIVTVVIDKEAHIRRYGKAAWHPYHYCLMAMLERYCGYLNFINARGDVWGEARGKKEDNELRATFSYAYHNGTWYRDPSYFNQTLTSPNLNLKPKEKNIAGFQLSDLLAYPSKHKILLEEKRISDPGNVFWKQIADAIETKYNYKAGTGRVEGYGKVFIK